MKRPRTDGSGRHDSARRPKVDFISAGAAYRVTAADFQAAYRWIRDGSWNGSRTNGRCRGPVQAKYCFGRRGQRAEWPPGRRARRAVLSIADDILYAFYDLGVAPITFDFLWFLVGAELERKRRSLSSVHAVIVPGPRDGLRKENPELERSLDPATRRGRIINLLVPACALLPTLSGVTLAGSREQADRLVEAAANAVFPAALRASTAELSRSAGAAACGSR